METDNIILNDFIFSLKKLEDVRCRSGQRHSQSFVLLIVLFATMSGYIGYRAIGAFIKKHELDLIRLFKPKKERVPSYSTVRRILMKLNPDSLQTTYEKWIAKVRLAKTSDASNESQKACWYSVDGKAIRGANKRSKTDYTHLVSIFSVFEKIVVASDKVGQKTNEIPCFQQMIEDTDLQGVIFTLDALHCQKKQ